MAQKWRNRTTGRNSTPRPLDPAALEALALAYVSRYATSRGKLCTYLDRKLRERGWAGDQNAQEARDAMADRFVALGYVDDAAFATIKVEGMARRGLGARRIGQALKQAGIDDQTQADTAPDGPARWAAAERFARRRHIGPFASTAPDRPMREKQIAAFMRAGHAFEMARLWVDAPPGEAPDDPNGEETPG